MKELQRRQKPIFCDYGTTCYKVSGEWRVYINLLRLIFGPGADLDYLWFINTKSFHHGTESSLKLQTTAVLNAKVVQVS